MKAMTRLVVWLVRSLEMVLVVLVLAGIVAFSMANLQVLTGFDWREVDTFYDFINRMLLVVIGLELIRMLVVHDLMAVLELLAFVIARKMLKPDVDALQLLFAVVAFTLLMVSRRVLLMQINDTKEQAQMDEPQLSACLDELKQLFRRKKERA